MIRRLRRRLACIFGALTSLVLIVMLTITCYLARSQYRLSQEVLYQTRLQSLTSQLQQNSNLSGSQLAQAAPDPYTFFYVEIGGVPLHYSTMTLQEDPERAVLLQHIRAQAVQLGFDDPVANSFTFLHSEPDADYQVTISAAANYLFYYVQSLVPQQQHLRELTGTYLLLGLAGVSALLILSAFLSLLATRPTQQALRQQQDFIAAASHELRSPLAVVRASLYAAAHASSDAGRAHQLDLADREAERMGNLIHDLLTLAGSGTGRWSLDLRPVELDTVCIQLYELFLPRFTAQKRTFQLLLPEQTLPVIHSDAQRLIQLLSALLSNALDHTPAGTEVALVVRLSSHSVFFSVVDHGSGIPDAEKQAVFRRFYRSDRSRTDKRHFGLGLSIALELSRLLGGRLSVQDTPGGGATFLLKLELR